MKLRLTVLQVPSQKQWRSGEDLPSPTASKVAKIGERKPYKAPPRTLAKTPRIGQRMMAAERHKHIKSFKTGPNCLALRRIKQRESLTPKRHTKKKDNGMFSGEELVTSLLTRTSKRCGWAKGLV